MWLVAVRLPAGINCCGYLLPVPVATVCAGVCVAVRDEAACLLRVADDCSVLIVGRWGCTRLCLLLHVPVLLSVIVLQMCQLGLSVHVLQFSLNTSVTVACCRACHSCL